MKKYVATFYHSIKSMSMVKYYTASDADNVRHQINFEMADGSMMFSHDGQHYIWPSSVVSSIAIKESNYNGGE
jgi:hypothetical protein